MCTDIPPTRWTRDTATNQERKCIKGSNQKSIYIYIVFLQISFIEYRSTVRTLTYRATRQGVVTRRRSLLSKRKPIWAYITLLRYIMYLCVRGIVFCLDCYTYVSSWQEIVFVCKSKMCMCKDFPKQKNIVLYRNKTLWLVLSMFWPDAKNVVTIKYIITI